MKLGPVGVWVVRPTWVAKVWFVSVCVGAPVERGVACVYFFEYRPRPQIRGAGRGAGGGWKGDGDAFRAPNLPGIQGGLLQTNTPLIRSRLYQQPPVTKVAERFLPELHTKAGRNVALRVK